MANHDTFKQTGKGRARGLAQRDSRRRRADVQPLDLERLAREVGGRAA